MQEADRQQKGSSGVLCRPILQDQGEQAAPRQASRSSRRQAHPQGAREDCCRHHINQSIAMNTLYLIGSRGDWRSHWKDKRMKFFRKPVHFSFSCQSPLRFNLELWHFRICHCGHSTRSGDQWIHHQGIMVSFGVGGETSPRPSWWGWAFVIPVKRGPAQN